ncbi:MAG TPA: septum formation initiator family protein [Solirubrobacteraceae bacterium]|jgi:cell division protein FtsB
MGSSTVSLRRVPAGIRWDRVGRVALLCVLCGLVLLYVGPARSYWHTLGQAKQKRAEVQRLEREHSYLEARRRALAQPGELEREARKLGYVKPGERAYVIEGLPRGR